MQGLSISDAVAVVTLFGGIILSIVGALAGRKAAPAAPAAGADIDEVLDLVRRVDERLIEINAETRGQTRTLDRIEGNVAILMRT